MKRQDYILKIDNPCGQDWASMTKNDIGGFCSHCSKTVVDFTNLTDNQVAGLIEKASGKLCGRLTTQQLNRHLKTSQLSSNPRLYKILAGLMLVGATENTLASDGPVLRMELPFVIGNKELPAYQPEKQDGTLSDDTLKNVVLGIVFDSETKETIPFANVVVKGTKIGAATDVDGKFSFEVPDDLLTGRITLVISSLGYIIKEVTIRQSEFRDTKHLHLIPDQDILLGEVVIIKKSRWWQRKRIGKDCQ